MSFSHLCFSGNNLEYCHEFYRARQTAVLGLDKYLAALGVFCSTSPEMEPVGHCSFVEHLKYNSQKQEMLQKLVSSIVKLRSFSIGAGIRF